VTDHSGRERESVKRVRSLVILAVMLGLGLALFWLARTPPRAGEGPGEAQRSVASRSEEPQVAAPGAERAIAEREDVPAEPRGGLDAAPGSVGEGTSELPKVLGLGEVRDEDDRPVAEAEIFLGDPWSGPVLFARSDADGRFRGELETRQGRFDAYFTVLAAGFEGASKSIEVRPRAGDIHLGTFRLRPGGEVSGLVLDEDGRGIEGAWVEWLPIAALPADPESARLEGPEEEGPYGSWFRSWVRTAEDGSFRARGLALGEWFLSAGADGRQYDWTPPFEVRGLPLPEVELVLLPSPTANLVITGIVQDPSGEPLPGAAIRLRDGEQAWPFASSDAEGRFTVNFGAESVDLGASDPEGRYGPVWAGLVAPGTRNLVLRLTKAEHLPVRLVDADGRAVPWGQVEFQGRLRPAGREGLVRLLRPESPFHLRVFAPGFRTVSLGPLEPPPVGEELVVTLHPGQALRGRVEHAGRAVVGARLKLCRTSPPDTRFESRNVSPPDRPFVVPWAVELDGEDGTSGGDGSFVLILPERDWYGLRVEAEGFPLTMFGPFELDPERAAAPLLLALERAGSLEGSVRGAPGGSNEGRLIAVANGWRFVRTAPLDAEGRYRIDDLAPGRYQVRPCEPPVASLQALEVQPSSEELAWDCTVRAGEATRFDLDLGGEGSVVLAGRLELVGARPVDWRASLVPESHPEHMVVRPRASAVLAGDGSFELTLTDPGRYRLEVRAGSLVLREVVALPPGRTEWHRRFEAGRLRLRVPAAEHLQAAHEDLRYVAADTGDVHCASIVFDAYWTVDASLVVPAGRGRIERKPDEAPEDAWTTWREVTIAPGQELVLEYP